MTRVEILDEGKMTAEQLKRNVDGGDIVDARAGVHWVSVKRTTYPKNGLEVYAMWGPTGTHCLSVASTDAERLFAHWRGFVEANNFRA